MVWYSSHFKNFPQFIVIHTVKGFGIVNKAEVEFFLELSHFFSDPVDTGNLISGSSSFSKSSLLWTEVCDIVQETGIKTILKKKKCKKTKWLSEEFLQIAVKRREVNSKGEKERYTHLNAEFQRIARRDKKAFLSDQYKEIKENNRMGKTRDRFKKIRDTKGTFHAKMGSIQKQKILRRGGKNTQKNYAKKIFMTQIIMIV